ncbi:MAG: hypothetical protein QM652_03350 [Legionella sp.]|uniref:hypothetical protein n=1 Tax=Legionella sp. TaxID=459 RepID=UPI0039E615D5
MSYSPIENNLNRYIETRAALTECLSTKAGKSKLERDPHYIVRKINTLLTAVNELKEINSSELENAAKTYQTCLDNKKDKHVVEKDFFTKPELASEIKILQNRLNTLWDIINGNHVVQDDVLIKKLRTTYDFDSAFYLRIKETQEFISKVKIDIDFCIQTEQLAMRFCRQEKIDALFILEKIYQREKTIEKIILLKADGLLLSEIKEEAKYLNFDYEKFSKIQEPTFTDNNRYCEEIKKNYEQLFNEIKQLSASQLRDLIILQENMDVYEKQEKFLKEAAKSTKTKVEIADALTKMEDALSKLKEIKSSGLIKCSESLKINHKKFDEIKNNKNKDYSASLVKKYGDFKEVFAIYKELKEEEIKELKFLAEDSSQDDKKSTLQRAELWDAIIERGKLNEEKLKKLGVKKPGSSLARFLSNFSQLRHHIQEKSNSLPDKERERFKGGFFPVGRSNSSDALFVKVSKPNC